MTPGNTKVSSIVAGLSLHHVDYPAADNPEEGTDYRLSRIILVFPRIYKRINPIYS